MLGYALVAFGAAAAGFFWFIMDNVPMTALGIGMAVVGSSLAMTPSSPTPSATVRRMLEGSLVNMEALLEELDVSGKGFYVPGKDGSVRVFAPMGNPGAGVDDSDYQKPPPLDARVEGLITKANGRQFLVVFPPAHSLMKNRDQEADGSGKADLEGVLSEALVEETGLADSVKATELRLTAIIEISSPKSKAGGGRVRQVMGSLEAGIAAAVVAQSRNRAVSIESEQDLEKGRKRKVTLTIHGA